jgi:hypothetical protein
MLTRGERIEVERRIAHYSRTGEFELVWLPTSRRVTAKHFGRPRFSNYGPLPVDAVRIGTFPQGATVKAVVDELLLKIKET